MQTASNQLHVWCFARMTGYTKLYKLYDATESDKSLLSSVRVKSCNMHSENDQLPDAEWEQPAVWSYVTATRCKMYYESNKLLEVGKEQLECKWQPVFCSLRVTSCLKLMNTTSFWCSIRVTSCKTLNHSDMLHGPQWEPQTVWCYKRVTNTTLIVSDEL